MNQENLLVIPTIKFVPLHKDNILRKFETSFRITNPELKISSASAFYKTQNLNCTSWWNTSLQKKAKS